MLSQELSLPSKSFDLRGQARPASLVGAGLWEEEATSGMQRMDTRLQKTRWIPAHLWDLCGQESKTAPRPEVESPEFRLFQPVVGGRLARCSSSPSSLCPHPVSVALRRGAVSRHVNPDPALSSSSEWLAANQLSRPEADIRKLNPKKSSSAVERSRLAAPPVKPPALRHRQGSLPK